MMSYCAIGKKILKMLNCMDHPSENMNLTKSQYFTNLDFPEISGSL